MWFKIFNFSEIQKSFPDLKSLKTLVKSALNEVTT